MATSNISIAVDAEAAQAYAAASDEQKRKLQLLLSLRLRELVAEPPRSLQEVMDEIGTEAQKRGLTPEILDTLLHGD
jgi:hypothetical protein